MFMISSMETVTTSAVGMLVAVGGMGVASSWVGAGEGVLHAETSQTPIRRKIQYGFFLIRYSFV
jgi:hypothetical protein